jgi:transposase-like protein
MNTVDAGVQMVQRFQTCSGSRLFVRRRRLMLKGMKAYSLNLRQKILRACDRRLGSQRAIATRFGVSQSCIEQLLRRHRSTGDIAPRLHAVLLAKLRIAISALVCLARELSTFRAYVL